MQSEALTRLANMRAHRANAQLTSPRSGHPPAKEALSPTLRLFAFPSPTNPNQVVPPQPLPDGPVSPLTLQRPFTSTSTLASHLITFGSGLGQSRAPSRPPTKVSLTIKSMLERLDKSKAATLISHSNAVPILDVSTLNENCPFPLFSRSSSKRPYKQIRTYGTAIVPRRACPELVSTPEFSPRPCQSPLPFSPSKRNLRQIWAWQFGEAAFSYPMVRSTEHSGLAKDELLSPKTIDGVTDGSPKGFASYGEPYGKGSIAGLGRSGRGRKRTFEEFNEVEGGVAEVAEEGAGAGEMEVVGDEADEDDEEFDEYDWLAVAGEEDLMGEHAVDAREMV